jgi:hypothetical protein
MIEYSKEASLSSSSSPPPTLSTAIVIQQHDEQALSSSSSSSLVLSSSSNASNSDELTTNTTTTTPTAQRQHSRRQHSLDEYEKRFLNSLKQLNAPEWLANINKPNENQCNNNTNIILTSTKPKYDRIRQKTRSNNTTNTNTNDSRSLSTPRNPKIDILNKNDHTNEEETDFKSFTSKYHLHSSTKSLLLPTVDSNGTCHNNNNNNMSRVNYAHLARSRHYASMRSDTNTTNLMMRRSLSSTPGNIATSNTSISSVNNNTNNTNINNRGSHTPTTLSSLMLASKSNTSLNSNRDSGWYKPKQLQLPPNIAVPIKADNYVENLSYVKETLNKFEFTNTIMTMSSEKRG